MILNQQVDDESPLILLQAIMPVTLFLTDVCNNVLY